MLHIKDFQFFDRTAEYFLTNGTLPHWEQRGATYFITYRLQDSIPQEAFQRIILERDRWLKLRGIDVNRVDWHLGLRRLTAQELELFRRNFASRFEDELDHLHGRCFLREKRAAQIVEESPTYFNGMRYTLGGFVVMPNHAHILVRMLPDYSMLAQCYAWKHYQARMIHSVFPEFGPIYQSESFDHIIRDAEHFRKYRSYIANNPIKAGLDRNEYVLYLPEIGGM